MGVPVSACPGEVLDVPIRENNTVQYKHTSLRMYGGYYLKW